MPGLDWLTARPIAHRGLHDAARDVIENTKSAVLAAVDAGYAVEVDLQIAADGEAMVFHDAELDRLTERGGRLDAMTAAELQRVPITGTADRMMTLAELGRAVAGRVPLLLELKSRFDGDGRLPARTADVLMSYAGPVAVMSFDPRQLVTLRSLAPGLPRGILAARWRPHPYWEPLSTWDKRTMPYLLPALPAWPHFVAYSVHDLPALAPLIARYLFGLPLLTWAVRTAEERKIAGRWADQMIFEGFRP
jgi:glycerophosphoryl diester phosphodiesterase